MTNEKETKMNKPKKIEGLKPKDWTNGCPEHLEYLEWQRKKLDNGSKHG